MGEQSHRRQPPLADDKSSQEFVEGIDWPMEEEEEAYQQRWHAKMEVPSGQIKMATTATDKWKMPTMSSKK
jgi:hypothetical protein